MCLCVWDRDGVSGAIWLDIDDQLLNVYVYVSMCAKCVFFRWILKFVPKTVKAKLIIAISHISSANHIKDFFGFRTNFQILFHFIFLNYFTDYLNKVNSSYFGQNRRINSEYCI